MSEWEREWESTADYLFLRILFENKSEGMRERDVCMNMHDQVKGKGRSRLPSEQGAQGRTGSPDPGIINSAQGTHLTVWASQASQYRCWIWISNTSVSRQVQVMQNLYPYLYLNFSKLSMAWASFISLFQNLCKVMEFLFLYLSEVLGISPACGEKQWTSTETGAKHALGYWRSLEWSRGPGCFSQDDLNLLLSSCILFCN